jgi:hypothetical protein
MFERIFGFDVWTVHETVEDPGRRPTTQETIRYRCLTCGIEEHGGGVPNPVVDLRMRQHLVESHIGNGAESLKREHISDHGELIQVWFGSDADEVESLEVQPIRDFVRAAAGRLVRGETISTHERNQIAALFAQFSDLYNPHLYSCSTKGCRNESDKRLLFRGEPDEAFGDEVNGRRICCRCKRVAVFAEVPVYLRS